jgi:hypothetical protein
MHYPVARRPPPRACIYIHPKDPPGASPEGAPRDVPLRSPPRAPHRVPARAPRLGRGTIIMVILTRDEYEEKTCSREERTLPSGNTPYLSRPPLVTLGGSLPK